MKNLKSPRDRLFIFLIGAQFLFVASPHLIFIQAVFSLVIGIYYALRGEEVKVISIISFITASEIYYKLLITQKINLTVPWEFPKYAAFLICIILFLSRSLARSKKYYSFSLKIYVVLILISFVRSIFFYDFTYDGIKSILGFYAMGPLALGATILAFDNIKMSIYDFKKIILYYFAGIIPSSVFLLNNLSFFDLAKVVVDSNKEFTGYGPIHVSLAMSFIAGMLLLSLVRYRVWKNRLIIYFCAVFFILVTVLTFSRSGIYALLPSFLVAMTYKTKNFKKILINYGIGILGSLAIYFYLNDLTGGSLKLRYTQEESDPRFYFIKTDIDAWLDNPIFGAGFGRSKKYRNHRWSGAVSHNEFTRFLAEQGVFGLFSLIIIISISINRLKKGRNNYYMPFILFLMIFSFLYFNANAFRTYLPGFAIGLAFISVYNKQERFT